jgi:nucleoside-diphosphate kinase
MAGVSLGELYIGSTITIYSRQLVIKEYADLYTRQAFEAKREKTLGMIKPDCYLNIGKIITRIQAEGFQINKLKMIKFTPETAAGFYAEHEGKHFFQGLVDFMISDVTICMELVREGAINHWRSVIGPTNSKTARETDPNSIRALFGTDGQRNSCHGSDSKMSAKRELDYIFAAGTSIKTTALLNNCSGAIIKPHAIKEGNTGAILDMILEEGYEISAMEMFNLDLPTSEEYFEVYKGVLPEFLPMIEHMTTGSCIAMEVRQENVVPNFRKLCGPHDPEIAKHLRPKSIRSKFGSDRVCNAVHCTDLPEDGVIDCEYFFSIMQGK